MQVAVRIVCQMEECVSEFEHRNVGSLVYEKKNLELHNAARQSSEQIRCGCGCGRDSRRGRGMTYRLTTVERECIILCTPKLFALDYYM